MYVISRVIQRSRWMEDGFLGKVKHFRNVHGRFRGTFDACLHFLRQRTSATKPTTGFFINLEFVHDWYYLILEGFVCNFAATQVNLVPNQYHRDLKEHLTESMYPKLKTTHVHSKLSKVR